MATKWKDIRKGSPSQVKPLTPEMVERLAVLDKYCEGMEPTNELLDLAHRYTDGDITFEKFDATVRSWGVVPEEEDWTPGPETRAAMEDARAGRVETITLDELVREIDEPEVCGEKKQTDILDLFGTIEFDPSYDVRERRNLDKLENDK